MSSATATFSFGGLRQAVQLVQSDYEGQLFARLWYMFWKSYASIGGIFFFFGNGSVMPVPAGEYL